MTTPNTQTPITEYEPHAPIIYDEPELTDDEMEEFFDFLTEIEERVYREGHDDRQYWV